MSVSFKAKITGEKIVLANIKKMERKFPKEFKKIVTKAVILGESQAKKEVPVDTGRLKNSITNKIIKSGDKTTGQFGTNVPYAKKVEFTNKPYIIPAWRKATRFFVKLLNRDIKSLRP